MMNFAMVTWFLCEFLSRSSMSDVTVVVRLRDCSVSDGGNCVDSGMNARDRFLSLALRMLKILEPRIRARVSVS